MANHSLLTERQQFWLEHLRSCATRGQSVGLRERSGSVDQRLSTSEVAAASTRDMASDGPAFRACGGCGQYRSGGAGPLSGVVAERGGGGKRER